MRRLLDFLVRKRHWFLFLLLEIVSLILVYRNTTYQRSVFISSANAVSGRIISVTGAFTSYLNLRTINRELAERNGQLEMEVLELQSRLESLRAREKEFTGFLPDSAERFPFEFIMAKVSNKSVSHLSNTITINKGRDDGVLPDMGVVSDRGVVGVVWQASDHYAVVLPLLNPKLLLNGKLKGTNNSGPLQWNGRDARYIQLNELPRHAPFQPGDTVVTSGYSAIFPAGIMIGTVADSNRQHDDNFNSLEIELATDFRSLNNVRVLVNKEQAEQRRLEKEVQQ